MEPFLFSLLVAWALVRYGVTDLMATAKGTESPRYRERRQRLTQQHERRMARLETGPTIGQAVAGRIATRIAHPKPPRDRSGQRPFRRFLGEWWEDAWNHATESRHRHHERKLVGDLPRQRASRFAKRVCRRGYERWRYRHHVYSGRGSAGGGVTGERATGSATTPPEAATERTGPTQVVAERLTLPESATAPDPAVRDADERQVGVLSDDGTVSTWPTTDPDGDTSRVTPQDLDPEGMHTTIQERKTTAMTDNHVPNVPAAPSSEITNLTSALEYTRGMAEQFQAAVGHAESLSAQASQVADWANGSANAAESSIAGVTAGEVSGEAVTSLHAAHEQMTVAATQVADAQQELAAAQEQFAATVAAFETAHAAFQRQQAVAEAYAANPDAGSKQFNTYA